MAKLLVVQKQNQKNIIPVFKITNIMAKNNSIWIYIDQQQPIEVRCENQDKAELKIEDLLTMSKDSTLFWYDFDYNYKIPGTSRKMTVREFLKLNGDFNLNTHLYMKSKYICNYNQYYGTKKYEKFLNYYVTKWTVIDYNTIHIQVESNDS